MTLEGQYIKYKELTKSVSYPEEQQKRVSQQEVFKNLAILFAYKGR